MKISVSICLALIAFSHCQLEKNQLTAYPDTYSAPTMAKDVPKSNYQAPKFSRSLLELDPTRKLRKVDFLDQIKYTLYQMTRGEAEQIFSFIDVSHDDLISGNEWDAFVTHYVLPFEACDTTGKYLLDQKQFGACFTADPQSKQISFRGRYEKNKHEVMMKVVETRPGLINFFDYLLIRRALFSWNECHNHHTYMSVSAFKCSLRLAVPQKYAMANDFEEIYKTGLKMSNDISLIQLDFIAYLRIIYFTYVFSVFGSPHEIPIMEKSQFIKAIKEDRLPNNFEEKDIEIFFDISIADPYLKDSQMTFPTFCFFFNLHRLFNSYSTTKPLKINAAELNNLMSDPLAPNFIALALNQARTNFKESEYLEASVSLQRLRSNERDFYYRFKEHQDASRITDFYFNKTDVSVPFKPIKENVNVFFSIFAGGVKDFWTKEQYYRAFSLANLFIEVCEGDLRWIAPSSTLVEKLPTFYDSATPRIALKYRKSFKVYKFIPKEVYVDILTFLSIESFPTKIDQQMNKSTNMLIDETELKIVMSDFGMKQMPDTVIDLSKKGFDSLRRRMYDKEDALKNLVIVQAITAENKRTTENINQYKIRPNDDLARKYPPISRRFTSSPHA